MTITLTLAWRNIWRNPRRTLLTTIAISVAATIIVFMTTMQTASYKSMIENTVRMSTGYMQIQAEDYLKEPAINKIVESQNELIEKLHKLDGIESIAERTATFTLVANGHASYGVQIVGVDPQHEPEVSALPSLVKQGRFFKRADAAEVIIGKVLAENMEVKVGGTLTILGSGYDGSVAAAMLTVVGIFDSGNPELDRNLIEIPIELFKNIFSMPSAVHSIVINSHDVYATDPLMDEIRSTVLKGRQEVVVGWKEMIPGMREMVILDKIANWFLYFALTLIVTFGVLNTFLMSVVERTKEFGIIMALGLKPRNVSLLIFTETLMLTSLGLILGVIVGGLAAAYFSIHGLPLPGGNELTSQFNLPKTVKPVVSFYTLFSGPSAMFLLIMTAGLYPALHILRYTPLEAIRTA
jgi:putative ABC transport system permease protein